MGLMPLVLVDYGILILGGGCIDQKDGREIRTAVAEVSLEERWWLEL